MKNMKKLFSLLMVVIMALSLALPVMAQDVPYDGADKGEATITISNTAKGETYKVVKVFDATVTGTEDGAIVYTGDIPEGLTTVFAKNDANNIEVISGKTDDEVIAAVTAWAKDKDATASDTATEGDALVFTNLPYGYYAVISSQGTVVTVTSTNPTATVTDKNTGVITANKKVGKNTYSIGDTVTYTATFDTVNFYGAGSAAQQVIKYTITDTLPEFLKDVAIDSIEIKKGETSLATLTNKNFNANGEVEIEWATKVEGSDPVQYKSLYDNGAQIIVEYHGTLTSVTNINAADKNTVKIQPTVVEDNGDTDTPIPPADKSWEDSAEFTTYAAALKKTDGTNALAGAKFKAMGLTVNETADGVYTVVSYDASSKDYGTEMEVDANGMLYIVGLASDVTLTVIETAAPAGYNKMTETAALTPQIMETAIYTESGTISYDVDGNVVKKTESISTTKTVAKNLDQLDAAAVPVVNNKGNLLPSTGGMGTTIFYVVGGVLVVAAGVLLITKKRMNADK